MYPILVLIVSALLFPNSMAAQDRTMVTRLDTFLLNDQHYDPSGDWKGVFCRSDNQKNCMLADVTVEQSKSTREEVNDRAVPVLTYVSRPGYRAFMFVKGLKTNTGDISNALFTRIELSSEPSHVSWAGNIYEFRLDHFNLLITKMSDINAKQSVPLFYDPNEACKGEDEKSIRLNVMLQFVGDIDGDQKADFLIYASSYKSCAITVSRTIPMPILLLSSGAPAGQFGRIVQSVAAMDLARADHTENRETTRPKPGWRVWVFDGKGESNFAFLAQPTLMGSFRSNLLLHPDLKYMSDRGAFPTFQPVISVVGKWRGFRVYDIIDYKNGLKQIVVKTGTNEFRLLYSLWGGLIQPEPSRLAKINGKLMLCTGGRVEGNGGDYVEIQFDYDSKTGTPSAKSVTTSR